MPNKLLIFFLFSLFSFPVFSQVELKGEATLRGFISTEDKLPFWMYHNQRGRITKDTNIAGWVTGTAGYDYGYGNSLEIGGGILLQDGLDRVFVDELYMHFESDEFYITAGRKQQEELYNGLSASNRNILWSLNARPIPGIQIGTNGPLYLVVLENSTAFGIEGSWNEYLLEQDRFVTNARLHHKNVLLVYRHRDDLEIKAGLQHFVQWAGHSPRMGKQPGKLRDYVRIFTGQEGGEDAFEGDQQNALGNHLGGYEFYIKKTFRDFSVELLYNHLFEDGSGRRLGNTPDGRYGVFLERKEKDRLVNSFIYEFFTTHHQSHTTSGVHKTDNYLNSGIYLSGWTYKNRVLGAPFFTVHPDGHGIINNKFTAHHIGIGGEIGNFFVSYPYKILLSYAQNDGLRHRRYNPKQEVAYIYSEISLFRKAVDLDLQFGAEYNSLASPIYGVGVELRKRF